MAHSLTATDQFRQHPYVRISLANVTRSLSQTLTYVYVGSNFQQLRERISGFDHAFHFADLSTAFETLSRMEQVDVFPDVILFDGSIEETYVKSFLSALHDNFGAENIIAIAEISSCSSRNLDKLKRCSLVDDLLLLDSPGDLLRDKVVFLKKVKSEQDPLLIKERLQTKRKKDKQVNSVAKRAFDIIVSISLIVLLLPVLLLIALAIRIETSGPVFYIAPRAGKGYKIFNFYKFRTMVVDADKKVDKLAHLNQYAGGSDGPVFFKVNNDPRITKVGAFLRNTSLDELLQLFNVLLGDMSLVGNRPLPLYEAATLTTDEYAKRFLAPAGITGLWQIKKRGDVNMSVEERISLDIAYAAKYNFAYDLWIIAHTPSALLQKSNA